MRAYRGGSLLLVLLVCVCRCLSQGAVEPGGPSSLADVWRELSAVRDKMHSLETSLVQLRERMTVCDNHVQELTQENAGTD